MVYQARMARPEPVIPVSAKMYRHFAVITVSVTACLAMFADGENRQAIQGHLAQQQRNIELRKAEAELAKKGKGGNTSLNFTDNRKVKGSFGSDESVGGSSGGSSTIEYLPPERIAGANVVFEDPAEGAGEGLDLPSSPPPGMTVEEFEQLHKQARKYKKKERKTTKAELDDFIAASEARSQTRRY